MTDFSTHDYLRALGVEVKKIRGAVNLLAVFALIQLALLFLWFIGVITIEFRPV